MNRVNLFLGLFAIISGLVFSIDVYAQRKIITSKEYYEGISKPGVKYYEKSRRVETTEETITDGVVTKSALRINEALLPNRDRKYAKITEGGKVSEFEQITIDYMQYTRKDGAAWTKVDLRQSGYGSGSGTGVGGSSRQCDQYSVDSTSINGRSMQLFEWLLIDSNGNELLFHEMRKWIGDDGLPYRGEDVKGKLSPREEIKRTVTTYEYDPTIKIEAPIK